jgi:hypothetical protein
MSPSVLLQLDEPLRSALKRILRQGAITFADLGRELGLDAARPRPSPTSSSPVAC